MKTVKRKPVSLSSPVWFEMAEKATDSGFEINAYTGAEVNSWFGKLVFDVAGMKSKASIPILREHKRDRIVGYGKGFSEDGNFKVSGKFVGCTNDALECHALAEEGYPWQASVGVRPVKVRVLSAKETAEVNGATVEGPAEIWLSSEVGEVSFVSLGADSNTSISVFSESEIDVEVEVETEAENDNNEAAQPQESNGGETSMTDQEFMEQHPETVARLRAEGMAEERARVMAILSQDGEREHFAVLKNAIELGTPADGIFKALYEAERNLKKSGLQSMSDSAPPSVGQTRDEVVDTPVKTFSGEVEKLMASGMTRGAATKAVAASEPELHKRYIEDINGGRK